VKENKMMSYDNYTDAELTALLKQGDEQAFERLYQKYSQRIYTNLKRLVKDDELAQELLQDLFVKIWGKRFELTYETSFRSYLYRISENLVRDFFRKAARDKKLMEHLVTTASELYQDLETDYIHKENNALLYKAIETLPPQRRKIFTLCKIEGKSYDEVSLLMGISNSTINDHIVKATKAIRIYFVVSGNVSIILIAAAMIAEH
jgi:RNA polymerase sigma-70 factor (family 1)